MKPYHICNGFVYWNKHKALTNTVEGTVQKERESVCEEEGTAGAKHLSPHWGQRHTTCTEVSLLGAQAEMSQNTWMWMLCVFTTPRMFFPRKVFLCPQEEACAKEFSGSSCCDFPISTHLPLPSKVFAQVIFFARPPIAKFVLAYFCSLFLLCFPLGCQSLFFTLSLLIVLMLAFPRYIWYINKIWSHTSRNIMNKLQRITMQTTVPQSQCNYLRNQSSDEGCVMFNQGSCTMDDKRRRGNIDVSTVSKKGTEGISVSRPGNHWLAKPLIKRQGELEGRFGAQHKAMSANLRRLMGQRLGKQDPVPTPGERTVSGLHWGTNRRQGSTISVDFSSNKFNKERKGNARERKICLILSITINGKDMSEMKVKWLGAQPLMAPGDHPQLFLPPLILAALPTVHSAC